jgi:hypothetical protein
MSLPASHWLMQEGAYLGHPVHVAGNEGFYYYHPNPARAAARLAQELGGWLSRPMGGRHYTVKTPQGTFNIFPTADIGDVVPLQKAKIRRSSYGA